MIPSFQKAIQFGEHPEFLNRYRNEKLFQYSDVIALHLIYGKEVDGTTHDFTNVLNNQTLKVMVADVLTTQLGWEESRKDKFLRALFVRNADLYMKVFPDDFTEKEKEDFYKYRESLEVDEKLVDATGPDFFNSGRWLEEDVTEDEKLMVLITDLVEERKPGELRLVNPESHILDWMITKRTDQTREYWIKELKHNYRVMNDLFPLIKYEDMPNFVVNLIRDTLWSNYSLTPFVE